MASIALSVLVMCHFFCFLMFFFGCTCVCGYGVDFEPYGQCRGSVPFFIFIFVLGQMVMCRFSALNFLCSLFVCTCVCGFRTIWTSVLRVYSIFLVHFVFSLSSSGDVAGLLGTFPRCYYINRVLLGVRGYRSKITGTCSAPLRP